MLYALLEGAQQTDLVLEADVLVGENLDAPHACALRGLSLALLLFGLDYCVTCRTERLVRLFILRWLERILKRDSLIDKVDGCMTRTARRLETLESFAHVDRLERLSRAQCVRGKLLIVPALLGLLATYGCGQCQFLVLSSLVDFLV